MHRKNNFDFLRLIFSAFVIITHSYPLAGMKECDWLCQITNGQTSFSYIGVRGFFVISGYLIFQSLERSKNLLTYYWKRFLRLFPALFIMLMLTVLLGSFIYENDQVSYINNMDVWTYLPNNLTLYNLQYKISGIFEYNPYKGAINGSLWTIPYEFTLYILVSLLFFVKTNKTLLKIISVLGLLVFTFANIFYAKQLGSNLLNLNSKLFMDLGMFFAVGSFMAIIKIEVFKYKNQLLAIGFLFLMGALYFKGFYISKFIVLPIIIILFGLKSTPVLNEVGNKIGDVSYGMYIYAFPIQQTLEYFFKLNYLELMFVSFIISFVFGYISWHLIEKRFLRLKTIKQNKF